jgi:serine phosphatase RsbU (regulator of sigma subunit)
MSFVSARSTSLSSLDAMVEESPAVRRPPRVLLGVGILAFLIAGLSIIDMALPHPYDGVVLEADAPGQLTVRRVVNGSGAQLAGIEPGDQIVGIDRTILRSTAHAAEILAARKIGDSVPYLIRRGSAVQEVQVDLGRRWIGSPAYLYACLLGFLFFFVGLYVLLRQPRQRTAQVFFLLATLFMLFLVCRLRPASYSWVDSFVLITGMVALLYLPACFLHFFLIFPRPVRLRPRESDPHFRAKRKRWLAVLAAVYLVPNLVLVVTLVTSRLGGTALPLISGAPRANWWVLAVYMMLGLTVLAFNSRHVADARARRASWLILAGSLLGLVPFLILAVAFPSFLHTEKFIFYGTAPLVLVPLTFAYAIVRFQLLEIRVILRKSLLYTATSAVVTGLYALGIAFLNTLTRGTALQAAPYFPIVFALIIVLLFEPLRRRIQVLVDHFFHAERRRLQNEIEELSFAFTAQVDLAAVVRDLVEKLPELLGLHFAALYLARNGRLERVAGSPRVPRSLDDPPELHRELHRRGLVRLGAISATHTELADLLDQLAGEGVEFMGELSSPRRRFGLLLLSRSRGQLALESEEMDLLSGLLGQAAIALETSMLLDERTREAELRQELKLAASLQESLLPRSLGFAPGWRIAAICRPARDVGGDFLTELPGPNEGTRAIAYGDVAGKSVSGALVMMAAHEVLHSLAIADANPERLLGLANQRLYELGRKRSFVALGYLAPNGEGVHYTMAGQPEPLVRRRDGRVETLPLPDHHMPLGALLQGRYSLMSVGLEPGDILLGYSDGVTEARSADGEFFGEERLLAAVSAAPDDPKQLIDSVIRSIERFTGHSEPYDDITLVAVTREAEVLA